MRFNHKTLGTALLLALAPIASATTWYVNGVSGSNSHNCKSPTTACKTIGHVISLSISGDTILIAAATYSENLTIGKSLNVTGSGAETTIVRGVNGTVVAISNARAHVTLSKMTILNGTASGIYNSGTLTVISSTITANAAVKGGGINNSGTLTISNSIVSGNEASPFCLNPCAGFGGGIYNANTGTVTIINSTLSGNIATSECFRVCGGLGGGILNDGGKLTISNSTLSGNTAKTFGGGGGIAETATLQNSIIANNSGGNCSGAMGSDGYNLSSDGSCAFNGPGDMNNINPMLGPLQNNGGPTQTMALLPGSPAIDAGNPSGCTDSQGHLLKTDQRGQPRPDKEDTGGCDMGAYERQSD